MELRLCCINTWNVLKGGAGEDNLDRSCERNEVLHTVKEERNILRTLKRRKANWIGHTLCRNCLLKHVVEGKAEGRSVGMTRKKT
jgi:hypothetical protein